MTLIKVTERSEEIKVGDGKVRYKHFTEEEETPISDILDFTVSESGDKVYRVEDRLELLEKLLARIIVKNPEDFKDYLQTCCDYYNYNYYDYKLKLKEE